MGSESCPNCLEPFEEIKDVPALTELQNVNKKIYDYLNTLKTDILNLNKLLKKQDVSSDSTHMFTGD